MKHLKALTASGGVAIAVALAVAACSGSDDNVTDVTQGTVIRNVTVVNTRDGSLSQRMAVVVDGGKIRKIAPIEYVRTGGTAQDVDASGKYVMPGFLDMHTHVFNAVDAEAPLLYKLLIANGVTGVREMGGSAEFVQRAKQLNADRAAGNVDAPEVLIIPGQIVGIPPTLPTPTAAPAAAATSATAATQEVQRQKGYGAGFIKTIAASRDATLALLAEAKNQGLYVAGHFSTSVGAKESSDAGWHASEHLGAGLTILLDCSANETTLRASLLAGTSSAALRQPILDSYDDAKCQALAQTFARNDTWHVPTLIRLRTGSLATDDALYTNDPNLIYASRTSRTLWAAAATAYGQANNAASAALLRRYYDKAQTLPKLLKQNGVKLLAGSDMSIHSVLTAPWEIPGFSLHQEFALLAAGGLTPLDILQMTTLNGAEFLGRQATMGTVDEGKNADLVLLDANPVESAANLDKVAAVFLNGKYFPKAALDKLKSDVANAYATLPLDAGAVSAALHAPAHTD